MKKLYLITRVNPDDWDYDEYLGFVIVASSEKRAFALMEEHKAGVAWKAEYIGQLKGQKEGIILSSSVNG